MTEPNSLVKHILFALSIRESHNAGHMSALEAETLLIDEGFYNIRFDAFGITSVCYLGVRYPLKETVQ